MGLVISDRVKETTTTAGTGTIVLGGALGGFQTFLSAVGGGSTTYYVIENDAQWEIGIGTCADNTLSRDTVLQSSAGGSKITLSGVSFVFCAIPADRSLYKNVAGNFEIDVQDLHVPQHTRVYDLQSSGSIGSSGLLTLRRETDGCFFHAYVDDSNDRTIALHSDADTTPQWKLGLKADPSDSGAAPTYAYIFAEDGNIGLYANSSNQLSLTHGGGFVINNQGNNIFTSASTTGTNVIGIVPSYPSLIVQAAVNQSDNIQEWQDSSSKVLTNISNDGSIATSGNISASGGVTFVDLIPNSTSNTLYNNGGTLYFNGSAIDAGGDVTSDQLSYVSGIAVFSSGIVTGGTPTFDDMYVAQYIYHDGDTNTYIRLRDDQMDFVAGGRTFLTLDEASQDAFIINTDGNDVDFRVESENDTHLIYTDAINDRVGIGTAYPDFLLSCSGTASFQTIRFTDGTTQTTAGGSSAGILANSASGVAISGWSSYTIAATGLHVQGLATANTTEIRTNSSSGVAISGWASYKVDANASLISDNIINISYSGNANLAAITANTTELRTESASGVAISGLLVEASGWSKHYTDSQDHSAIAVSGYLDYAVSSGASLAIASGNQAEITALGYAINSGQKAYDLAVAVTNASGNANLTAITNLTTELRTESASGAIHAADILANSASGAATLTELRVESASGIAISGYFDQVVGSGSYLGIIPTAVSGYIDFSVASGVSFAIASGNQAEITALNYAIDSGNNALNMASGLVNFASGLTIDVSGWVAGGGGGGGGSSRSVAGDTDNAIITWVTSDNTFAAESTFLYDGSTVSLSGDITADGNITLGSSGTFISSGVASSGLRLGTYTPLETNETLYNDAGTLKFNGSAVGLDHAINSGQKAYDLAVAVTNASGNANLAAITNLTTELRTESASGAIHAADILANSASGAIHAADILANSASGVAVSGYIDYAVASGTSFTIASGNQAEITALGYAISSGNNALNMASGLVNFASGLTIDVSGWVAGGGGGGGGGAVSAVANGVDNRVATFSSSDALNGEANLTFDGSNLVVNGTLFATVKSFLIDHPTKEGMNLQYACLEGPENGVYVRGAIENENVIELPDYWTGLVDESSITTQLTPKGYSQPNLFIDKIENNKIYLCAEERINAYYIVHATRKDVDPLEIEWPK